MNKVRETIFVLSEKQFMAQVTHFAKLCGWHTYHTLDSRGSAPGFPDVIAVRDGRLLALELKTERGQPTPEQCEVLELLQGCPGIECFLFRPSDWDEIERLLR